MGDDKRRIALGSIRFDPGFQSYLAGDTQIHRIVQTGPLFQAIKRQGRVGRLETGIGRGLRSGCGVGRKVQVAIGGISGSAVIGRRITSRIIEAQIGFRTQSLCSRSIIGGR